jgi:hypothetical protein
MQPDNSEASKIALALLRSDGTCTFDLTMNSATGCDPFGLALAAAPSANAILIPLSAKPPLDAGQSIKIGSFFAALNSSGSAIAALSRRFWNALAAS